jgi:hypothetical protein
MFSVARHTIGRPRDRDNFQRGAMAILFTQTGDARVPSFSEKPAAIQTKPQISNLDRAPEH